MIAFTKWKLCRLQQAPTVNNLLKVSIRESRGPQEVRSLQFDLKHCALLRPCVTEHQHRVVFGRIHQVFYNSDQQLVPDSDIQHSAKYRPIHRKFTATETTLTSSSTIIANQLALLGVRGICNLANFTEALQSRASNFSKISSSDRSKHQRALDMGLIHFAHKRFSTMELFICFSFT